MSMDPRPDPDRLLKHVQAEEEASGRGRLKLFFGAGPGVGKTHLAVALLRREIPILASGGLASEAPVGIIVR